VIPAKDVHRQVTIAIVEAVKESFLLLSVQRVIGIVKVQDQKAGRLLGRSKERTGEKLFQLRGLRDDLLAARSLAE
jgi:hypothetical protein